MLVTSRAFAVSTVEEWKKRACANCFAVAAGRQTLHCEYCSQVFYCSAACDWDPQHSFPSLLPLLLEARKSKKCFQRQPISRPCGRSAFSLGSTAKCPKFMNRVPG